MAVVKMMLAFLGMAAVAYALQPQEEVLLAKPAGKNETEVGNIRERRTDTAFGSATAWGDGRNGGFPTVTDSNRVVDLSANVVDISCGSKSRNPYYKTWESKEACVARFENGSATAWGNQGTGGDLTNTDSNRVVNLTANVVDISCGGGACVALFENGSATAWGDQDYGGDLTKTDTNRVVDLSANVVDISCGGAACVALFENGSATAWGSKHDGGDLTQTYNGSRCDGSWCNPRVVDLSANVVNISCGGSACVARFKNGSATAWGSRWSGADLTITDSNRVVNLSANVVDISCGRNVCVARFKNGSATAWGDESSGGDLTKTDTNRVVNLTANVVDISCGGGACVALFENGSATAWGFRDSGGDLTRAWNSSHNRRAVDLSANVVDISCGRSACVARFKNGSAAAWGDQKYGGDLTKTDTNRVVDLSANVVDISCGGRACVARFENGSAAAWGSQNDGGDLTETEWLDQPDNTTKRAVDLSANVVDISCGGNACVARFGPPPTTNPSGPTTNPSPGPTTNPTSSVPSPTDECDSKLFQQYNGTGFKVASKNDAFEFITKIKTAFKAIKKSYRAAKTNLRKLGREAKE